MSYIDSNVGLNSIAGRFPKGLMMKRNTPCWLNKQKKHGFRPNSVCLKDPYPLSFLPLERSSKKTTKDVK